MKREILASLGAVSVLLFAVPTSAQTAPTKPEATSAETQAAAPAAPAPAPAADAAGSVGAKVDVPPPPAPTPAPAAAPTAVEAPDGTVSILPGWKAQIYGFLELDAMRDSTQSFSDAPGNTPLLRSDGSRSRWSILTGLGGDYRWYQYGATHPRTIFSARNTRIGLRLAVPEFSGIKMSGVLETDFMGASANPFTKQTEMSTANAPTEGTYFSSAALRMRHAYVKIENPVVDVLFGQYYHLFGFQPYYFPASAAYLGLPNEIFGRTPQVRLTKVIRTAPINIEISAAALRPAQADGRVPDLQGGVRLMVNPWKGAHGSGGGQATLDPLSIGVSGVYREFRVGWPMDNGGDPTLADRVAKARSRAISIDGYIPIIPIRSLEDKSNSLSLTGSYVSGSGIGDLYSGGLSGGAPWPRPLERAGQYTAFYGADIDPGIVMFVVNTDTQTVRMRLIKWTSYMAGFQYFLPIARGKVVLTANYTHSESPNLYQSYVDGGDPARTFDRADYYDVNLFLDWTRHLRTGLSWQRIRQSFRGGKLPTDDFLDQVPREDRRFEEKNDRFQVSGYLFF